MSNRQTGVQDRENPANRAGIEAQGLPSGSTQAGETVQSKIKSGHGAIFRKLWASESNQFRDHLLRLDKNSRRMRFAHSVSDAFIEDYAGRMAEMGAIVHGAFIDGELRAVAELRKLSHIWGTEAETAFSVEPAFQNRGIGNILMGRVIRSARNRRIRHLYISCLPENGKMQSIAKKHEAELRFEYGDVIGDIVPQKPDYVSIFAEAMEDRVGYMLGVLDIQGRMMKHD